MFDLNKVNQTVFFCLLVLFFFFFCFVFFFVVGIFLGENQTVGLSSQTNNSKQIKSNQKIIIEYGDVYQISDMDEILCVCCPIDRHPLHFFFFFFVLFFFFLFSVSPVCGSLGG